MTDEVDTALMAPIAALLNDSPKSTATKVATLIDLAAALLARDGSMRRAATLAKTADAARERLVTTVKATHRWIDERVAAAPAPGAPS